ncbi:GNAT family N-acetyltransferase [Pedobacter gandavensis]|uniref:GNAT family N-acetyltransferase n=1 Tax=Pedobacter gandavensis TaxID=2679963 RepID=UPI00292CF5DA|nr:GNAT family N-acetyltransferase [Pedobacter gandavensis]
MTYQLITIHQHFEWVSLVQRSLQHDFYHTWHYHSLDMEGEPLLFVYEEQDVFIAIPLLKREIEGTHLYDLTSAYGYTGPISNRNPDDLEDKAIANFKSSFLDFMKTARCVCAFCRLKPFLRQERLLENFGGIYPNGQTVVIDLKLSIEEQRLNYDRRLARKIRQLRTLDFEIRETEEDSDIKAFAAMYLQNMRRNGASERYLHQEPYFRKLLNTLEGNCKLIMVYYNHKPICGHIITYDKYFIRNHLSATHNSYVSQSPGKLIIDEISLFAREKGIRYYHLGGGLNGQADSLFQFKAAFSNLVLDDKTWCFIADPLQYQALANERSNDHQSSYFPRYRNSK